MTRQKWLNHNPGTNAEEVFIESITFKLISEDIQPITESVKHSIYNNPNLSDVLKFNSMTGTDKKARNYYRYGRDKFILGLMDISYGVEYRGDNSYPPLDPVVHPFGDDEFFPLAPIIESRYLINSDKETEQYITTRNLLKRVSLNLNDLTEGLKGSTKEGLYEENPDFDKLDDVYFILASDVYSENKSSIGYQYHFFEYLYELQQVDEGDYSGSLPDPDDPDPPPIDGNEINRNYIGFEEREFSMKLSWNYVSMEEYEGRLAPEIERVTYKKEFFITPPDEYDYEDGPVAIESSYIDIFWQKEDNLIVKLRIVGLTHESTSSALGEKKIIRKTLSEEFIDLYQSDDDEEKAAKAGTAGFYLPISQRIMEKQNYKHRQVIISDSMTLILVAAESVQLKWYQTIWFRIIITIVVIYISIIAPYLSGIANGVASSVVVTQIVTNIAISFAIAWGLKYLFANTDGPLKYIAAAAAMYIAIRYGQVSEIKGMPFVTELLHSARAVLTVSTVALQGEMEGIATKSKELSKEYEDRMEEIRDAESELDYDEDFVQMFINNDSVILSINETPDQFYDRTIHIINQADATLQAPSRFVAQELELDRGTELEFTVVPPLGTNLTTTLLA